MTGRLAATLALATLCACHALGPEATLARYFRCLAGGDVKQAYALTTRSYRARHDLVSFAAATARQPTFSRSAIGTADTVVELRGQDGEPVVVIGNGAAARLAHDPLDLYPNDTPEHALRSFARALRLERTTQLARLLAASLRGMLQARPEDPLARDLDQAARTVQRLLAPSAGLPSGVLVLWATGARLLLGEGRALLLGFTADGWVITGLE